VAHLRAADPVMAGLVDRGGPLEELGPDADPSAGPTGARGRPADLYGALVRAIVGQQLSVLAARAIFGRLIERFGGRTPTPEEVLADDPDELRVAAGLSRAKVVYLRSLAEHVRDGRLELDRLADLPDDEVLSELVQVKGLGVWSAHMFLIFTLGRPDVLAVGDLGIRKAVQRAYGWEEMPTPAAVEALGEPWRPWRSVACRYLWRSLDNAPL
jgi:DNA-3-methyladenine glycosylase II